LTANFKGKSVLQPVGPLEKICFLTPFNRNHHNLLGPSHSGKLDSFQFIGKPE